MADAERKRRIDYAHETQNLTYGHFGTAIYDERATHTWRFLRKDELGEHATDAGVEAGLSQRPLFRLLHDRVVSQGDDENDKVPLGAASSARGFKQILRNDPDLAFAVSFYKDEDEGDPEPNHDFQSLRGQRLAYGYAAELNSRRQPVESDKIPIIAMAAGRANELLCIKPVIIETITIEDEAGFSTDANLPVTGRNAIEDTSSLREPILQICFSRNGPGGMHIGIRRASSVTVLRSTCTGASYPESASEANEASRRSEIELNEILDLPISRTGESTLADIAFNPAEHHELAVIDTLGRWSIWKLTGKQSGSARVLYKAHLQISGHLAPPMGIKSSMAAVQDGWHQLCWLYDTGRRENVLLVCNRQRLHVYDIDGESLGDVDMRLGVKTAKHQMLDLQFSTTHPELCFILTSTRVMVMSAAKEQAEPLELICSWAHGRGAADMTLKMSVLELSDKDGVGAGKLPLKTTVFHLFLYPRRSCEVTYCTLRTEALGDVRVFAAETIAFLPLTNSIVKHEHGISDMVLRAVPNDEPERVSDDGVAQCLVSIIVRSSGGNVIESVYEYGCRALPEGNELFCVGGSGRFTKTRRPARQVKTDRFVDEGDELDDFLVRGPAEADLLMASMRGKLSAKQPAMSRRITAKTKDWKEVLLANIEEAPNIDLVQYLAQHYGITESNNAMYAGQTAAEMLQHLRVEDVDETSEALSSWLSRDAAERQTEDKALETLSLGPVSDIGLVSLYDKHAELVNEYVGSLSLDVSDRTRVETERQLRHIGLEAVLASYVFQKEGSEAENPTEETPQKQNIPPSSESHPEPALSRLSKYTNITNTTPASLNTSVIAGVLGHLPKDINTDPSSYSYNETEFDLAMAREDTGATTNPRTQRHAEQLTRRGRKTLDMDGKAREAPARNAMSSQAEGHGSSQFSQEHGFAMTQPLSGVHGQRERLRKRGDKRKAGF